MYVFDLKTKANQAQKPVEPNNTFVLSLWIKEQHLKNTGVAL